MTKDKALEQDTPIMTWLKKVLKERQILAFYLAKVLGVSHATVSRWLSGKDIPTPRHCERLAKLTGEHVLSILILAGHLTKTPALTMAYPPFRAYMAKVHKGFMPDLVDVMALAIDKWRVGNHAKN